MTKAVIYLITMIIILGVMIGGLFIRLFKQ